MRKRNGKNASVGRAMTGLEKVIGIPAVQSRRVSDIVDFFKTDREYLFGGMPDFPGEYSRSGFSHEDDPPGNHGHYALTTTFGTDSFVTGLSGLIRHIDYVACDPSPAASTASGRRLNDRTVHGSANAGRSLSRIASADVHLPKEAGPDRFMRYVYDLQTVARIANGYPYVPTVPHAVLTRLASFDTLPNHVVEFDRDIARNHLTPMLTEALSALAADRAAETPAACGVTDIRVIDGYRSARAQLGIWKRNYADYFRETAERRATLPGGEHGDTSAKYLAGYIDGRLSPPGYSPHQRGRAIDLTYCKNGIWMGTGDSPDAIVAWHASWLYAWLLANALRFGFKQTPDGAKPWHWEYWDRGLRSERAVDKLKRGPF